MVTHESIYVPRLLSLQRPHSDPFRTEKSAHAVSDALRRFPVELEHFVDENSRVEIPQDLNRVDSSFVTVITLVDKAKIDEAVANCLRSLDLFAEKLPVGR